MQPLIRLFEKVMHCCRAVVARAVIPWVDVKKAGRRRTESVEWSVGKHTMLAVGEGGGWLRRRMNG